MLLFSTSFSWGQVGVWKFESAPGNVLVNTQTPGTKDGTLMSGTVDPTGKVGKCLDNSAYGAEAATLPFLFNPSTTTSFSVGVWVKLDVIDGLDQGIVAQGAVDWLYRDNASNRFASNIGGGTTFSTTVMAQNVWYYVSVVASPASLKLYVNGNLETTAVMTAAANANPMSKRTMGWLARRTANLQYGTHGCANQNPVL